MKSKLFLLIFNIILLITNRLSAQELDNTFGNSGIVNTSIGMIYDECNSIIQQSDGKIIAAGKTIIPNGIDSSHFAMSVIRLNPNGSLDNSFGIDGKVILGVDSISEAQSVLVQNDGKIILAGYAVAGDRYKFAVARLNADGSTDYSFGTEGRVTTEIGNTAVAFAARIQPDGKIILAGKTWSGIQPEEKMILAGHAQKSYDYNFAIARYTCNGVLDSTFGVDGIVNTFFEYDDEIYALGLQPDGKIVATGITGFGYNYNFAIARYNSDGSLDSSFGTNGKVIEDLGTQFDIPKSILIQNDGKIIISGNVYFGNNYFVLVRYKANGNKDETFGTNGISVSEIDYDGASSASILQNDGKILLAGTINWFTNNANFCMQRFNNDGSIDNFFGNNGLMISELSSYSDFCNSAIIQSDGKIILAGGSYSDGNIYNFALARYTNTYTEIIDNENNTFYNIYPNPAKDFIFISDIDENTLIQIYNVNGKFLIETKNSNNQINISSLKSGIYFLKIQNSNGIVTKKFVKQ